MYRTAAKEYEEYNFVHEGLWVMKRKRKQYIKYARSSLRVFVNLKALVLRQRDVKIESSDLVYLVKIFILGVKNIKRFPKKSQRLWGIYHFPGQS